MRKQVTCIHKLDRDDPRERITHIGGDGWIETSDQAIQNILLGRSSYYVGGGLLSSMTEVIVRNREGRLYLTTEADAEAPNNLLSLSECPLPGQGGLAALLGIR